MVVNFLNVRIQHQLRCVAPKKQRSLTTLNLIKFQRNKTSEDDIFQIQTNSFPAFQRTHKSLSYPRLSLGNRLTTCQKSC
ncbi:hypothetical protein T12_9284 [Trichinella patagoniensis]|uniref:Uncharacterized protein n=1 Tax=Trichinella patagoniensis TaxID=990121 RepID=A0A0V1AB68_9BILA|nr:hypothetical protein T12_9284 [Trichinella patagoniensis]